MRFPLKSVLIGVGVMLAAPLLLPLGEISDCSHGYVFIMNQADGSYKPDEIQQKSFQIFMDYFDKHLRH